jgi:DNA-binding transcriptional regulator YbjK
MAILDKLLRRNTMSEVANAIEVNCATGEVTERPLTAEEITQREANAAAAATAQAEADAKAASDAAAKDALLTKLGITADEAKLLLA